MYVLDTYALYEIRLGNPEYECITEMPFMIPDTTIAEYYILLMKEYGEADARYWYKKLIHYCVPVDRNIMIKGLKFREENKKKHISIFDAIGYIYAQEHNLTFVTGDKEFEKKEGVKFIKK